MKKHDNRDITVEKGAITVKKGAIAVKKGAITAEKGAITEEEETRHVLSVIEVSIEQQTNVSSLDGFNGVENGRPKGSTKANTTENENPLKIYTCMEEISKAYEEKKTEMRAAGRERVSKGFLANLIRQKKKELGVSENYDISEKAITTRFRRTRKRRLNPILTARHELWSSDDEAGKASKTS